MTLVTLPGPEWVEAVGPVPGLDTVAWHLTGVPDRADEVRVVVPPYMDAGGRIPALAHTPGVELVQLLTAGYEDVQAQLPDGVTLANAAGVHDASAAELAVLLTMASDRKSTRLNSSHANISYAVFCLTQTTAADRAAPLDEADFLNPSAAQDMRRREALLHLRPPPY